MDTDSEFSADNEGLPDAPTESRLSELRGRLGSVVGRIGSGAVTAVSTVGREVGGRLERALTGTSTSVEYNGHYVNIDGGEDGIIYADALFAGAVDGHDLVLEYNRSHGLTVELLVETDD